MEIKEFDTVGFNHIAYEDEFTFDTWRYKYDDGSLMTIIHRNNKLNPYWLITLRGPGETDYWTKMFYSLEDLLDYIQE